MASSRARKRHVQLDLDSARKEVGRGGWRRHAGRKRKPGATSHDTRADLRAYHPQHVTLRLVEDAPKLARGYLMGLIRKTIVESHKDGFHLIEFNVLDNHLHLIIEAASKVALARGMQGFAVRLAKRLNSALKRKGKWFASRYHARSLRTPREVFNALKYVLLNRKHHAAEKKFSKYWVDPFSSAPWFTGWAEPISKHAWTVQDLVTEPAPTKPPSVWLLTTGWKQHGLLRFEDTPAYVVRARCDVRLPRSVEGPINGIGRARSSTNCARHPTRTNRYLARDFALRASSAFAGSIPAAPTTFRPGFARASRV